MEKGKSQKPDIRLHCLGGNPAPPPLLDGWRRLVGLPQQALDSFGGLLGEALMEPALAVGYKERLEAFCREHALAEEDAAAAVQTCSVLLRQASAFDLDRERFREDLAAMSGGESDGAGILLANYDAMKGELRNRIVQESLADHGKVLVGLDWRLDNVVSSDRGARLDASVILLTLRYREGDRLERITLQLTRDALKELKLFTERIGK